MKYIVKKSWFAAKEGEMLHQTVGGSLKKNDGDTYSVIPSFMVQPALDQGFIEPYEEKPKRFKAMTGERFYTVDLSNGTFTSCMYYHYLNGSADTYYENSNYFKSLETTKAVAEALKLFFEWLHTPREVTSSKESKHWADMYDAMNKARELVLADNEAKNE